MLLLFHYRWTDGLPVEIQRIINHMASGIYLRYMRTHVLPKIDPFGVHDHYLDRYFTIGITRKSRGTRHHDIMIDSGDVSLIEGIDGDIGESTIYSTQ